MNGIATAPVTAPRLQVRELNPSETQEWDQFVLSCPSGTFFHLYGWTHVVEQVLGHHCFRLVALRGSQIAGVFPIAWVQSRLFGDCLVSTPLAVYGGIAANDREAFDALLQRATELGTKHGVKYVEMRNCTEEFAVDLPGRDLYVNFTQDLTPGPDRLMQGLPRDTRYMVRKSMKNGLEWVPDLAVDTFYDIYAHSVHRLGTPVFPKRLFAKVREHFPQHCRIFGVRKENATIAGVLCFYFRDQVLPYYGGSLAEFNRDAPNNFMYWSLIAQSCAEGLRHFDFGRSKKGTGSYTFKSAWSMKETTLPYRYQLVKARDIPHLSPMDKKFQLPIEVWKRLPFATTKVLGPAVIRWIPSL